MGPTRREMLTVAVGAMVPGVAARAAAQEKERPIGDEGVGPGEDLMREHGVLRRALLIYDEGLRRIRERESVPAAALHGAADVIRRVIQDYHERLEEEYLFPRFERARLLVDLVTVLRQQHRAGRAVTASIFGMTAPSVAKGEPAAALGNWLAEFIRMYRPHAAREDTVLFPGFRGLVTKAEYARLGALFEDRETRALGERGFERAVEEVAEIERGLGIYELASFTPKT